MIASLGILHGANDIAIIRQQKSHVAVRKTSLIYIGIVLLGGLAFFFIPALALLCFVLVSAYHFGEQHLEFRYSNTAYSWIHYFVYGSLVFALIFFFHQSRVQEVVEIIAGLGLSADFFVTYLLLSFVLFVTLCLWHPHMRQEMAAELFILLILTAVFATGSLLYAFGCYFVIWHSFPSLKSQMHYLYPSQTWQQQFYQYFRSSLWYWVAALLGLAGSYVWIDFSAQYILSLFFTFLAAITFPHVVVMQQMFHSKK